ncbi:alpha/beta fold hydrolase [Salininema proteolyticum]|uniref:Alpha/beta fold hydrolase n=1 Tax=Salininema proteolyticum TaxID=1607685 RepID=A0ABV8TTI0_9ACTN
MKTISKTTLVDLAPYSTRPTPAKIIYDQAGSGDHLVICVHGLGLDRSQFANVLAGTTPTYTTLAVDLPGHGASPRLDEPESILTVYANIVRGLTVNWVPKRLTLVGAGMGYAVAAGASRRRSDGEAAIPSRVISIEGNVYGEDCAAISRRVSGTDVDDYLSYDHDKIGLDLAASLDPADRHRARTWPDADPLTLHAAASQLVDWCDDEFLRRETERVCPAYLHGEHGQPSPPGVRRFYSDVHTVPQAGHAPLTEQPRYATPLVWQAIRQAWTI